ncbi:MAG TPA: glycosyltransferase [Ktedonobacteraceae bacterium]|jgi:cellulose synthase/poly-beta-1,6-N-acetylglucosamine synthase-like glycosyltransferase|nr:glycosyltransferase [Ktedonobacteraceae bacterium]
MNVLHTVGHLLLEIMLYGATGLSLMLIIQSGYTLYIMLYTWDLPEAARIAKAPTRFLPPRKSFTVMLPARHEEEVIQTTIERVVRANYPLALLEVVVICSIDDIGTIAKAQQEIAQLRRRGIGNVRVLAFKNKPINKPHGLNVGLRSTRNEVVTIFDAEDDIHPDIFNVINTVLLTEKVSVVQGGVQLMNYQSKWYSVLNVLEYFFWFKSRLHYHARLGMTPLGGNTVFFTREVLQRVGGWDEYDLTEDADIGIRISLLGERMRVIYDDRYVTREETPPTLKQFIKQRTRWSQGFLQTLLKGDWKRLPRLHQRMLAIYTLGFPVFQATLGLYILAAVLMMFTLKVPVLMALILDLPFYLLAAHFILNVIGLYEFTHAHGLKPTWKTPLVMLAGYLPYQWVLAYAAVRATSRHLRGINNWEKTQHVGAHRQAVLSEANALLQGHHAPERVPTA